MSDDIIQVIEQDAETLDIPAQQVYRYLGLAKSTPDEATAGLVATSIAMFRAVARFRAVYRVLPCRVEGNRVELTAFSTQSSNLAKNLDGCERVIVFAATAGTQTEQQRRRAEVLSPAQAVCLDAVGTAAIEAFCDLLCDRWRTEFSDSFLRPRFSPGYGDLPLAVQPSLLAAVDAFRKTGVSLTEALLMLPQKSVSAIVGIGSTGCTAPLHDCTACDKTNCQFRL